MEVFWKTGGVVLIALILGSLLAARDKTYASLLTMGLCAMVLLFGLQFLSPVMDFLRQLEAMTLLQSDMMKILLKVCGIGILTEIIALLCADSGNASVAQSLRTFSTAAILWMSLPVFQSLLDLIREILEGI